MKIQNPFAAKQFTPGGIALSVWFIVATIFAVIYLKGVLYDGLYQKGFQKAVDTLIESAGQCDPITVTRNGNQINLVNLECLKPQEGDQIKDLEAPAEEAAAPAAE